MKRRRVVAAAVASLIAAACGSSAPPSGSDDSCSGVRSGSPGDGGSTTAPTLFVPFATDFCGYHSWKHFDLADGTTFTPLPAAVPDESAKPGETITAYINHFPPPGSTSFPIGTIIVKQIVGGTDDGQAHAMVKRGGSTYNPDVPGWEWLELQDLPSGGVHINWFGVGPPNSSTDIYGGDPTQGCNGCHKYCLANDAACSKTFQLSKF